MKFLCFFWGVKKSLKNGFQSRFRPRFFFSFFSLLKKSDFYPLLKHPKKCSEGWRFGAKYHIWLQIFWDPPILCHQGWEKKIPLSFERKFWPLWEVSKIVHFGSFLDPFWTSKWLLFSLFNLKLFSTCVFPISEKTEKKWKKDVFIFEKCKKNMLQSSSIFEKMSVFFDHFFKKWF